MSNLLPVQRTKFETNEEAKKDWLLIDAEDQILGRLASRVASLLMGKHKPTFAPHQDNGDFVIVVNAAKIQATGKKMDQKVYYSHSLYPGGMKTATLRQKMEKDPTFAIIAAVKRMLPKGALGRKMLRNLKVYADSKHEHQAQKPVKTEVTFR